MKNEFVLRISYFGLKVGSDGCKGAGDKRSETKAKQNYIDAPRNSSKRCGIAPLQKPSH